MSSGWQNLNLGEIVENKSRRFDFNNQDQVVFINTGDVLEGKFLHSNTSNVKGLPGQAKKAIKKGDLLYSEIRPINKRYALVDFESDNYVVSTKFMVLSLLRKDVDLKYLYTVLTSNFFIKTLQHIAESRSGTFPQITFDAISYLPLSIPPLPEQKSIAHTLGTLEDKIELNRKMNETLEQIAQALFKSWFVDFDTVLDNAIAKGNSIPEALKHKAERRKEVLASGKYKALPKEIMELFPSSFVFNDELEMWIPEGWNLGKMEEIVNVKYGKDHKKLEDGSFPCYGSGGIMRYVNSTLCNEESVLIPRKGTLSNIMYVRNPFWSVDTMFFTEFKQPNYVKYLFYFLQKFNFTEMNVGSAVPSMTTKVLNSLNLLQPSEQVLKLFDEKVEYFLARKEANEKQNESLVKQRDVLLPKLISGKLRLSLD